MRYICHYKTSTNNMIKTFKRTKYLSKNVNNQFKYSRVCCHSLHCTPYTCQGDHNLNFRFSAKSIFRHITDKFHQITKWAIFMTLQPQIYLSDTFSPLIFFRDKQFFFVNYEKNPKKRSKMTVGYAKWSP